MDTTTQIHSCVFFIGLHGVGKTTVGRHLHKHHGWMHISLGDLGRLARSRKMPREHSVRFMGHLVAQLPGQRLSQYLIDALLSEIKRLRRFSPVSVDGFPVEPYHMDLLPPGAKVFNLEVEEALREERLIKRSENTVRQWASNMPSSSRDADLPRILELHRDRIATIDATHGVAAVVDQILSHISPTQAC